MTEVEVRVECERYLSYTCRPLSWKGQCDQGNANDFKELEEAPGSQPARK